MEDVPETVPRRVGEAPKSYNKEDPERRRERGRGGHIGGHEEISKDARRRPEVHDHREFPGVRW